MTSVPGIEEGDNIGFAARNARIPGAGHTDANGAALAGFVPNISDQADNCVDRRRILVFRGFSSASDCGGAIWQKYDCFRFGLA